MTTFWSLAHDRNELSSSFAVRRVRKSTTEQGAKEIVSIGSIVEVWASFEICARKMSIRREGIFAWTRQVPALFVICIIYTSTIILLSRAEITRFREGR